MRMDFADFMFWFIVVALLCFVVFGATSDYLNSKWRREAVAVGVAEFVVDANGQVGWRWKYPDKKVEP